MKEIIFICVFFLAIWGFSLDDQKFLIKVALKYYGS